MNPHIQPYLASLAAPITGARIAVTTGVLLASVACGLDTPGEPTWTSDIQPITRSNCARCHTPPAIGGAPPSFRLDIYEDTIDDDGNTIRGAGTMGEYIATRTDYDAANLADVEPMPPRFLLSDRQSDMIFAWWDPIANNRMSGVPADKGPAREDNNPPTIVLRNTPADTLSDGMIAIEYEIRDRDHDVVYGTLYYGANVETATRIGGLHSGRDTLTFDLDAQENRELSLLAVVNDDNVERTIDLGGLSLPDDDNNVAPTLGFSGLGQNPVIADIDSPLDVTVAVTDPDAGDSHTLSLVAQRGQEQITLAQDMPIVPGDTVIAFDTAGLTESAGWRLIAAVNDGINTRTIRSPSIVISHATTTETFASISDLLSSFCTSCHPGANRIPNLTHSFFDYNDLGDVRGVYSLRGLIYERVARQRNMPPNTDLIYGGAAMTEAQRQRIAQWILAGAPE